MLWATTHGPDWRKQPQLAEQQVIRYLDAHPKSRKALYNFIQDQSLFNGLGTWQGAADTLLDACLHPCLPVSVLANLDRRQDLIDAVHRQMNRYDPDPYRCNKDLKLTTIWNAQGKYEVGSKIFRALMSIYQVAHLSSTKRPI